MAAMTDQGNALALYPQAFAAGAIPLQPCPLDPSLFVAVDHPNRKTRFSSDSVAQLAPHPVGSPGVIGTLRAPAGAQLPTFTPSNR